MTTQQIDADYVRSRLLYNTETGVLAWKPLPGNDPQSRRWNTRWAGRAAGRFDSGGYLQIEINGRIYLAHRLAWLISTGEWPVNAIDHIDVDKSNNRWSNLRHATGSQNQHNKPRQLNNTSGFKGVTWKKDAGRWEARIRLKGRRHHLGYFNTPESAHAAYCRAAAEMHREFANAG